VEQASSDNSDKEKGRQGEGETEPVVTPTLPNSRTAFSRVSLSSCLPVCLLVCFALALRLWGITWGLPNQDRVLSYHPDEGVNLGQGVLENGVLVQGVLENGVPHPHLDLKFYNYGGLYFYLWQGAVATNRAYGIVSLPPTGQPNLNSTDSPAAMILVGRLLTAFLGAATVWAVFALGNRLFGRRAGLVAGLVYAILPAAVIHGHYATVDVPATFFVTLALVYGAKLLASPCRKDAALAGLFCGLAAATKYNVVIVFLAPLAAIFLRRKLEGKLDFVQGAIVIGAGVGGFVVGCAGLLVNWSGFTHDFTYELQKSSQGMGLLFADTGNGWLYHLTSSLRFGMGVPMLLVSLAALVLALKARTRQDWYLLAFLIPYYLVIGLSQVRYLRYVIPLFPVLAVLIGRLMARPLPEDPALQEVYLTVGESEKTLPIPWPKPSVIAKIIWAVGGLAAAITLLITLSLDRMMSLPDTRDQAATYLKTPDKQGKSIAFVWLPWYQSPPLSPDFTAPSPKDREQAALSYPNNRLLIPARDTDWDASVLGPPLPDFFAVSEYETGDAFRINLPATKPFTDAWRDHYTPHVFEKTPSIFGIDFGKPAYVPNDWLYIYPRTTIYERKS
jgi:hypothetical protein